MTEPLSALDRMIRRTNIPVLDAQGVAKETAAGDWILLFADDPVRRPEVADLAVILPEIVKGRVGSLNFGVIDREAEDELAPVLGVLIKPSLVFLRDGEVTGVVPRVKDWVFYEQMLAELLPLSTEDKRASA